MDIIFIQDLQLQTIIGIYDWERKQTQSVHLDIEIGYPTLKAAQSDQITDCIDYYKVAERLKKLANEHNFKLVEAFTEEVSRIILNEFGGRWVRIKLSKPDAVDEARGVGVIIERGDKSDKTIKHQVFVGIGSNIDREKHIRLAVNYLTEIFGPDCQLQLSPVYETKAVGFSGADFYNLVACFNTSLNAFEVAKKLKYIELENGRDRTQPKFSARTLDIDLLLYDQQVIDAPGVQVPRDEIEKYAFVLAPLADLVPENIHPITLKTFQQMWSEMAKEHHDLQQIEFKW